MCDIMISMTHRLGKTADGHGYMLITEKHEMIRDPNVTTVYGETSARLAEVQHQMLQVMHAMASAERNRRIDREAASPVNTDDESDDNDDADANADADADDDDDGVSDPIHL